MCIITNKKLFKSREYFSLSALFYIIDHFFLLTKIHKNFHFIYKNLLLGLKENIYFNENGFCVNTSYVNNNVIGGRLFVRKKYSLQKIDRRLRGALVLNNMLYFDIDMVNAQFNILLFYCIKKKIECVSLKNYVQNRDNIFKEFFSNSLITKDEFKKNFCKITFFGRKLSKQHSFLENESFKSFFLSFKKEIQVIFNQIVDLEENLYILHKPRFKNQNKNGSFFALFLQNIEKDILLNAIEITKNFLCLKTDDVVLIHDGFMIPKFLLSSKKDLSMLLKEINHKIEILYGYPFIFTQKFMDTSLINDSIAERLYEQDNQIKLIFSKKKRKRQKFRILKFILENIDYSGNETRHYFTIKNLEWLVQSVINLKVKSIDILHCLKTLINFQKSIQKRLNKKNCQCYFFGVKSKDSKILFLFDQIKNKSDLSEEDKGIIIKNLNLL